MGIRRRAATTDATPQVVPTVDADSVHYSRWFNEDALVNQRLTWLLLAQGLLFAAYGTVAIKAVDACDDKADYLVSVLGLISTVGSIFAVLIFFGIGAAVAAQWILHRRRRPSREQIGVHTTTTIIGWITCLSVPVVFFVAWLYIPGAEIQRVVASCKAVAATPTPAPPTSTPATRSP